MAANRGRLILGARPLARHVFGDDAQWRTLHNGEVRSVLGLFMLGPRLAGYENIIDERLDGLVAKSSTGTTA
jgi:hypothetical protein